MDFQVLQTDVIKALRGKSTQSALSKALGYSYNQVQRWENGKVGFYWADFVTLCRHRNIDIAEIFSRFFETSVSSLAASDIVAKIIGLNKIDALAKQIKKNRFTLYRWVTGKTEPTLADVLFLSYKCSNFMIEFLSEIVDIRQISGLAKEAEVRANERAFHYQNPVFAALVRCFELTEYENMSTHSDAFVAQMIGIEPSEAATLIDSAVAKKILKRVDGKLTIVNKSLTTKGDVEGRAQFLRYWLKRELDLLQFQPRALYEQKNGRVNYLIFTTNEKTYEKILALTSDYNRSLQALLHHDDNRAGAAALDRVIFLHNQLSNLNTKPIPERP